MPDKYWIAKNTSGKTKVAIDENQLSEVINVETLKTQLEKAVFGLEEDFVKNLSLRSTAGAIESIPVTVDGTTHSLQEIAQIVRKNPKMVVINMSAFPQYIPDVVKAIGKSGMNLNPQQDGTSLFVPIPKVTKEHREGLSKSAKQLFTRSRDTIKDIQIKYVKQIKKKEKISEDLVRSVEQQIIAIADSYIQEAEKLLLRKQEELLGKD
ncbi:ribosome-recycling factor, mitochondrial isoform X2 [Cylas formicarius]|uniref:ribosome-recycling factor, mitochondrial isoform X2 n=1 Tax=Cylas formicarius TaxID=197179 RepID=UPI002958325B|nr:ribosome-recycling factor, mitochondrial isoform X2 [Cylas formicarius]